jgi:predicted transcriptional regulator
MSRRKPTKNQGTIRSVSRGGRLLQPLADADQVASTTAVRQAISQKAGIALSDIIHASSQTTLLNALAERTGVDALIFLVSQNDTALSAAVQSPDPLRAARSRAAQKMAELVRAEGGPMGAEEVAEHLGISRAAVDKRRKKGALLGIQDGARAVRYPSWQFVPTGVLVGLPEALGAIGIEDPWMRLQFFLSPDGDLGVTPLEALRAGRVGEVVAAAAKYGRLGEDASPTDDAAC